jgi:gamma-glutamyltranspeptidase/glutathione hydrolase
MELSDLAAYKALDRDPTHIGYRGLDVYGMAPPSSGGSTVGEILNILEGYSDLGTMPRERALHLYLEASRLAYADRGAFVADPGYVSVPLAQLLSDQFAAQRRAKITETAATSPVPAGDPSAVTDTSASTTRVGSTTNLTVTDRWGNVVDYTFTIEQTGGNGMVVPGYGFLLNNELTDFNLTTDPDGSGKPNPPGGVSTGANKVEGGKRPRSSIAPTIVLRNGRPFLALGSPGGASIITTVAQILVNRLDFGMTLPEAVAAPRLSQRNAATTQTEASFLTTPEAAALQARGQSFVVSTGTGAEIGAATGIEFLPHGALQVAAEPVRRGGGSAAVVSSGGHRPHGGDGHGGRHRLRAPHDVKRPGARR